jgi:hypothetical protein
LIVWTANPRGQSAHHYVLVTELSDGELYLIAAGGRTEDDLEMKLIPPMPLKD